MAHELEKLKAISVRQPWADDGQVLDEVQSRRLLDCGSTIGSKVRVTPDIDFQLSESMTSEQSRILQHIAENNGRWFEG
jgi:hypothetical protein